MKTEAEKERHRAYCRAWYARNREKALEASTRWERANRKKRSDRQRERRAETGEKFKADLRRRYGISAEEYAARLSAQGGGCAVCGALANPDGRRLVVDHDHKTGRVRGILCRKCNTGIGALGDNAAGVARALTYLQQTSDYDRSSDRED